MLKIGVLALQGAVNEHLRSIEAIGAKGVIVKKVEQLADIDGIILPGGESTAIGRLMKLYGFDQGLTDFHAEGKPIFGTCAGMILLAKEIEGEAQAHLGLMDIKVERNAFGRQVDSFEAEVMIPGVAVNYPAVFIRAPYVKEVYGEAKILAKFNQRTIAAEQGSLLATSFHPELTDDTRFHAYFAEMIQKSKQKG